ncbi:hypothetical protein GBAR_LOCUS17521, partial [Geodia barretti]
TATLTSSSGEWPTEEPPSEYLVESLKLVEATLRTEGRPVTVIPTWCVRLWSVLQSWMTGLTLTGLTCPLNID